MYDFRTAIQKIRERTVFLGKEWMYTHAVSSTQPQAATRYLLAAAAVMDDALEAYIDLTWGTEAPKSATTLGKRIDLLAREGHLRKAERMKEIKELRNVYAHDPLCQYE